MTQQTIWLVLAAATLLIVLFLGEQSAAPTVSTSHVDMRGADDGAMRIALSELRVLRGEVSTLQQSVRALQARATTARGTSPLAAVVSSPLYAGVQRTSSSVAPTSFLDALDDGSPHSTNFSVLAPLTTTQPECGMLLFRHIEKTGGTTFRMHTISLHPCGWHVWGYKGTIRLCNKARAEFAMIKDPSTRPAARNGAPLLPKLTVESHAEHGDYQKILDSWRPMVQAWRGTCGLWLVSIVRDPLKRQVSHFSYHKTTRGFDIKHIKNFTHYFSDQYVLLNRRSNNPMFLQRHILLPRLLDMERANAPRADLEAHAASELDKFDVIGVFENYTASMLLMARATGLPLSKYSVPATVKNRDIKVHRSFVQTVWADELATDAQRAFFMQHLDLDYWIYNEVRRRFDKLVAEGGAEYAAQLRELMRTDATALDASMERVCTGTCESGMNKEESTNRFVWKDQQCWPPADRELASCGKNPHLKPDFNPALCG